MSEILTTIGSVFTMVIGSVGDVVAMVVANPILLIPIAMGLVGTIIAFARKFM